MTSFSYKCTLEVAFLGQAKILYTNYAIITTREMLLGVGL
jgi:hypothetical protein